MEFEVSFAVVDEEEPVSRVARGDPIHISVAIQVAEIAGEREGVRRVGDSVGKAAGTVVAEDLPGIREGVHRGHIDVSVTVEIGEIELPTSAGDASRPGGDEVPVSVREQDSDLAGPSDHQVEQAVTIHVIGLNAPFATDARLDRGGRIEGPVALIPKKRHVAGRVIRAGDVQVAISIKVEGGDPARGVSGTERLSITV